MSKYLVCLPPVSGWLAFLLFGRVHRSILFVTLPWRTLSARSLLDGLAGRNFKFVVCCQVLGVPA